MKKSLKKGFTLVELVIVIAVIAILSAVLIPTFGNVIENSKTTSAYENARNAMTSYSVNNEGASIGDGWVVVFNSAQAYIEGGSTGASESSKKISYKDAYVFQYKDGQLVKEYKAEGSSKGEVLKSKLPTASTTFTMSKLDITADTWEANTTPVTAIPLNYKFTSTTTGSATTYGVTATVWWFAE